jgi:ferredoxin
MSLMITEDCINCGACMADCPNHAIYEPGTPWRFSDGTYSKGLFTSSSGFTVDAEADQPALSDDFYYVVPDKCTECEGFYDEPQCVELCPIDCCVDDPNIRESKEQLVAKKISLHGLDG